MRRCVTHCERHVSCDGLSPHSDSQCWGLPKCGLALRAKRHDLRHTPRRSILHALPHLVARPRISHGVRDMDDAEEADLGADVREGFTLTTFLTATLIFSFFFTTSFSAALHSLASSFFGSFLSLRQARRLRRCFFPISLRMTPPINLRFARNTLLPFLTILRMTRPLARTAARIARESALILPRTSLIASR